MRELKEECGVFGVYGAYDFDVARMTYFGLSALQHRGEESCGIALYTQGRFIYHKDVGLVNEVFSPEVMHRFCEGKVALGHVRYCTTGENNATNAQPIVVNHINGTMAVGHNGNLVNSYELRKALELEGAIFYTTNDTEVIAYLLTKARLSSKCAQEAMKQTMEVIEGAFSLIVMVEDKMVVARDQHGFRPLCYGKTKEGHYVVASESCALDVVGAEFVRDVEAGEIVVFDKEGVHSIRTHCQKAPKKICSFEYIYFARGDSVLDGVGVHSARLEAGRCLAQDHPVEADLVIGVPDSGIDAALGYARESQIPYSVGFVKNKYIARTFISSTQQEREHKVKIKLNPIVSVVKDKRLVLIDDSIVRGTTSARIIKLLWEAGAKEIHMRISAPPFLHPCYYGTDIDSAENLIASKYTLEQIREKLGLTSLGYLNLSSLAKMLGQEEGKGYCDACFSGAYPTNLPCNADKHKFSKDRHE